MGGWDRMGLDDLPLHINFLFFFLLILPLFTLNRFIFKGGNHSLLCFEHKYIEKKRSRAWLCSNGKENITGQAGATCPVVLFIPLTSLGPLASFVPRSCQRAPSCRLCPHASSCPPFVVRAPSPLRIAVPPRVHAPFVVMASPPRSGVVVLVAGLLTPPLG